MDYGTGLTIIGGVFGVSLPAAAVWITVIKTKSSKPEICALHSGIEAKLEYLTDGMDEVKADVKELLRNKAWVMDGKP